MVSERSMNDLWSFAESFTEICPYTGMAPFDFMVGCFAYIVQKSASAA